MHQNIAFSSLERYKLEHLSKVLLDVLFWRVSDADLDVADSLRHFHIYIDHATPTCVNDGDDCPNAMLSECFTIGQGLYVTKVEPTDSLLCRRYDRCYVARNSDLSSLLLLLFDHAITSDQQKSIVLSVDLAFNELLDGFLCFANQLGAVDEAVLVVLVSKVGLEHFLEASFIGDAEEVDYRAFLEFCESLEDHVVAEYVQNHQVAVLLGELVANSRHFLVIFRGEIGNKQHPYRFVLNFFEHCVFRLFAAQNRYATELFLEKGVYDALKELA